MTDLAALALEISEARIELLRERVEAAAKQPDARAVAGAAQDR